MTVVTVAVVTVVIVKYFSKRQLDTLTTDEISQGSFLRSRDVFSITSILQLFWVGIFICVRPVFFLSICLYIFLYLLLSFLLSLFIFFKTLCQQFIFFYLLNCILLRPKKHIILHYQCWSQSKFTQKMHLN